uniref:Integrator complex subunit 10 n=1 Tax=Parascaris univalens TaxID=6257 RepID=A0A915CCN2_PARUN
LMSDAFCLEAVFKRRADIWQSAVYLLMSCSRGNPRIIGRRMSIKLLMTKLRSSTKEAHLQRSPDLRAKEGIM